MKVANSLLSYCTNVHAGESWSEAFAALQRHVPAVRGELRDGDSPFGLGLRLSHASVVELERDAVFDAFCEWLEANALYVFTINAFPYGPFHGQSVKADVYRPDWTEPARLDYTCRTVSLAARLAQRVPVPEQRVSISTLPGTYKPWSEGAAPAIAAQLLRAVAHCVRVQRESGIEVTLALEPEPCCLLETAEETCRFFAAWLHTDAAHAFVARESGSGLQAASEAIRRHLGVCHDVCHSAVEFEPALDAVQRYACAGVPVMKLQLSSALRLAPADKAARAALHAFDEPVYLHQVVACDERGRLRRFSDIGDAMAAPGSESSEWRVHFHVPVFLARLQHFDTTQATLAELLDAHARAPIAPHLEVETYTWDVLPEALRNVPIEQAIAREIEWVQDRLSTAGAPTAGVLSDAA